MKSTAGRRSAEAKTTWKVRLFWASVAFSVALSTLIVAPLAIVWASTEMGLVSGGNNGTRRVAAGLELPWTGGKATFNWHPLLMVVAFVPVMVQSALSYRIYSRVLCTKIGKGGQKALHAGLHALEAVLVSVSLAAVFTFHSHRGYAHLASLHSWLGALTVTAFVITALVGGLFYLTPKRLVGEPLRRQTTHYHRLAGIAVMAMAYVAMVTGITEQLAFDGASYPGSADARLGQALGVLLPFVALPVAFLLTKSEYRRRLDRGESSASPRVQPLPEQQLPGSLRGTGAVETSNLLQAQDGDMATDRDAS